MTCGRTKKETGQRKGFSFDKLEKFLKIITLHNPRNSKNSLKNLIFSLKTKLALFKACALYLLVQIFFVPFGNGTYDVVCPICWDHYIPCLMYFKIIYSFL